MAVELIPFPPKIDYRLSGWNLTWTELRITGDLPGLAAEQEALPGRIRTILGGAPIAEHKVVRAVRSLFRTAGCDPTRYRPSSESLMRRLQKGEPLPAILPAVDINNIWSVELLVPCCVIVPAKVSGRIIFRAGQPGEIMHSMRGPFNLEGKPVLVDSSGPFGTPITDSERVKVTGSKGTFWLVAYLPEGVIKPQDAIEKIRAITLRTGGALISGLDG